MTRFAARERKALDALIVGAVRFPKQMIKGIPAATRAPSRFAAKLASLRGDRIEWQEGLGTLGGDSTTSRGNGKISKSDAVENESPRRSYNRLYRLKNRKRLAERRRAWLLKHKESTREYHRMYRPKHKDIINENHRRWESKNKKKISEKRKAYRLKNREAVLMREKARRKGNRKYRAARQLWKRHKMTVQDYEAMYAKQGGLCAICGGCNPPSLNNRTLHVDHDHKTNRVRGLLCLHCNTGVGHFRDSPERLIKAAEYISSHQS